MAKAKKTKAATKTATKSTKKSIAASGSALGDMLRKARESKGVSQGELAARLDTKRTAISRIENHADDIKVSTLEKVAKALGMELKVKIQ